MVYKTEKLSQKMKCKEKQRKGLWSPEEDEKLRSHILKYGHGCWSTIPLQAGLQRNGKSCRLRWVNYLRPGLKKGFFTKEEETTLLSLHSILGNKWSQISKYIPGRTDNEIKNYWHSYVKKSVTSRQLESTNSLEALQSTTGRSSSCLNVKEPCNAQVSRFSPTLVFSEWLDHSLVLEQSSQKCGYVQDLLVPEQRSIFGTRDHRLYENNSSDHFRQNSVFLLDDELEFCSSFSDILFDGITNEKL